jgi:hypothetical protein
MPGTTSTAELEALLDVVLLDADVRVDGAGPLDNDVGEPLLEHAARTSATTTALSRRGACMTRRDTTV